MNFTHYIITKLATRDSTKKWLDSRLELFFKFYIKGLSIQKNNNFKLVFLVSDEISFDLTKFLSIDFDFKVHSLESFNHDPSSILTPKDLAQDYIISSRLDSDDLLANHYVENIQKHAVINSIIDHKHYYFVDPDFKKFSLESSRASSISMFLSTCFIPSEFNEKHCYVLSHFQLSKSKIFARKVFIPSVGSAAICHGPNSNSKWFRKRKQKKVNIENFNNIFS
jgi:hypothetical protein